jgi:hypothetical protein
MRLPAIGVALLNQTDAAPPRGGGGGGRKSPALGITPPRRRVSSSLPGVSGIPAADDDGDAYSIAGTLKRNGEFDIEALLGQAGHVQMAKREEAAYYSVTEVRDGDLDQRLARFRATDRFFFNTSNGGDDGGSGSGSGGGLIIGSDGRTHMTQFMRRMEALSPSRWSLAEGEEAMMNDLQKQYRSRLSLMVGATLKPELHVFEQNRARARQQQQTQQQQQQLQRTPAYVILFIHMQ